MQGARKQGRDGKRKADLETIRSALEIYKADCNAYPSSIPLTGSWTHDCGSGSNTYIEKMPEDPSSGAKYAYSSSSPYSTYTLCSTLEDPPSPANDTAGCGSCTATCAYKVTSP
jgi:hypothetical protein